MIAQNDIRNSAYNLITYTETITYTYYRVDNKLYPWILRPS